MKNEEARKGGGKQAGARIPDKPRDCGPNVDTWPILDQPDADAPEHTGDKRGRSKSDHH